MFEVGFTELLLIFALALVVLGPEKLPRIASQVGRWIGRAKSMARQFREQLEEEANVEENRRKQPPPQAQATPSPSQSTPPPPETPPPAQSAPEADAGAPFAAQSFGDAEFPSAPAASLKSAPTDDSAPGATTAHDERGT